MSEFILVLKGTYSAWNRFSAEEKQQIMSKYMDYVGALRQKKALRGGSSLASGSRSLKKTDQSVKVDGPFPETKEVLTGYFVVEAKDFDEAVELAKLCPALDHGDTVEVYPLSDD